MDWIFTHHAIKQINERNIPADIILKTLKSPDEILPDINYPQTRVVYQRIFGRKLVRVFTEDNLVIAVYMTNNIDKYFKRGKP